MTQQIKTLDLPQPASDVPVLSRMISEAMLPGLPDQGKDLSTVWSVTKPHPLLPKMTIVRMHAIFTENDSRTGVEIYSMSEDGRTCMRNFVPERRVRFTEEVMTPEVFVEELSAAEGDDDDDDDLVPDDTISAPPAPVTPNGQSAS